MPGSRPRLLIGHEQPLRPSDLFELPSLGWGANVQEYTWDLDGPDGAVASIRYRPRLVSDDVAVLRQGALAGVGVVLLPEELVRADLAAGRLVPALEDWTPRKGEIVALFPSRRGVMPAVRKLIDFWWRRSSKRLKARCDKPFETGRSRSGRPGSCRLGVRFVESGS